MLHVLTGDYVAGSLGTSVAPSSLGPWLTWAETGLQDNPAVRAAGIKAMIYSDPNRTSPGSPLYTGDESTFAHTCSGGRITTTGYSNLYLMDPSSSAMRTVWGDWIGSESQGIQWDAVFDDDTNDVAEASGTPCGFTTSAWLSATLTELASVSPAPIIYNGLQFSGEMNLNAVNNVLGGMEEGCYSDSDSRPNIYDPYWSQIENVELAMAQQNKLFVCLGRDSESASTAKSIDSRLFTYASFLLTYTPSSSILWDLYGTASGFHVQPETKLVALNPLVGQPGQVSQLQQSTGVYAREYQRCYIAGVLVGACASVVNPDRSSSHAYPFGSKYSHTLLLTGGGILDGGNILTTGGSPPSSLGPTEAVIVLQ